MHRPLPVLSLMLLLNIMRPLLRLLTVVLLPVSLLLVGTRLVMLLAVLPALASLLDGTARGGLRPPRTPGLLPAGWTPLAAAAEAAVAPAAASAAVEAAAVEAAGPGTVCFPPTALRDSTPIGCWAGTPSAWVLVSLLVVLGCAAVEPLHAVRESPRACCHWELNRAVRLDLKAAARFACRDEVVFAAFQVVRLLPLLPLLLLVLPLLAFLQGSPLLPPVLVICFSATAVVPACSVGLWTLWGRMLLFVAAATSGWLLSGAALCWCCLNP